MMIGGGRRADRAIIYRSEIDFVSRCILDCPNFETGGELFGFCNGTRIVRQMILKSVMRLLDERRTIGEE